MQGGRTACAVHRPDRLPVHSVLTSLNSERFVVDFHCSTPIHYYGLRNTNTGKGKQLNGKGTTAAAERIIGCHGGSVYHTGCGEGSAIQVDSRTENDRAG